MIINSMYYFQTEHHARRLLSDALNYIANRGFRSLLDPLATHRHPGVSVLYSSDRVKTPLHVLILTRYSVIIPETEELCRNRSGNASYLKSEL